MCQTRNREHCTLCFAFGHLSHVGFVWPFISFTFTPLCISLGALTVHVLPFTALAFKEMQKMGFSLLEDLYVWNRKSLDAVFYVKRLVNFQWANFLLKFQDNGHFSKSNAVFSFTVTELVVWFYWDNILIINKNKLLKWSSVKG